MLWEDLNLQNSNWENVTVLFAAELPSLKKLNMKRCTMLNTISIESIRLIGLGKCFDCFVRWRMTMVLCCESIWIFKGRIGRMWLPSLRPSCPHSKSWIWVFAKSWTQNRLNQLGWLDWVNVLIVSSDDELLWFCVVRGFESWKVELGECGCPLYGRAALAQEVEYVLVHEVGHKIDWIHWIDWIG